MELERFGDGPLEIERFGQKLLENWRGLTTAYLELERVGQKLLGIGVLKGLQTTALGIRVLWVSCEKTSWNQSVWGKTYFVLWVLCEKTSWNQSVLGKTYFEKRPFGGGKTTWNCHFVGTKYLELRVEACICSGDRDISLGATLGKTMHSKSK